MLEGSELPDPLMVELELARGTGECCPLGGSTSAALPMLLLVAVLMVGVDPCAGLSDDEDDDDEDEDVAARSNGERLGPCCSPSPPIPSLPSALNSLSKPVDGGSGASTNGLCTRAG